MDYYTTKQIIDRFHFTQNFLQRCINRLHPILEKHIIRGNNNSRLYDTEAINIFDIIYQKKNEGMSIPEIENFILQGQENIKNHTDNPDETIKNRINTDELVKSLEKHHQQEILLHEQIRELEKQKLSLENGLKLLTDGKSPFEVKQEWEQEQRRLIRIELLFKEIKSLSITQFLKRKKLYKELDELLGCCGS